MTNTWLMRHGQTKPISAALCMALLLGMPALARDSAEPAYEQAQFIATECSPLLNHAHARHAIQLVRVQLLAQGMQLVVQACPFVRAGAGDMRQVVDVRVVVKNSDVATQFVRGPLADDEEVDMGAVHLELSNVARGWHAAEDGDDVSPDVLFNRQWLADLMEHLGLRAVPHHWWAFEPAQP